MLIFLLLLVAFGCFTVEAIWHRSLLAAGLAAWVLTVLIGTWPA